MGLRTRDAKVIALATGAFGSHDGIPNPPPKASCWKAIVDGLIRSSILYGERGRFLGRLLRQEDLLLGGVRSKSFLLLSEA
jgi:hypothetical protein